MKDVNVNKTINTLNCTVPATVTEKYHFGYSIKYVITFDDETVRIN